MEFLCSKCGACCRVAAKYGLPDRGDGGCVYLDENDLCSIYDHRPLICRVGDYGKSENKDKDGDLKNWYVDNTKACHDLIDEFGLDEKYKIDIKEYDAK
jgi:Fe-S-cluster containining protein